MIKRKYYLACDLKDENELIEKYKQYHQPGNVPVAIVKSIKDAGVENMEIFLTGNRLFMVMTVNESFDLKAKAEMDAENPEVQKWEKLMDQYQQYLPWAGDGEKWVLMEGIFDLWDH